MSMVRVLVLLLGPASTSLVRLSQWNAALSSVPSALFSEMVEATSSGM